MDDFLKQAGEALSGLAGQAGRQAEVLKLQATLGSLDDDLDRAFIEAGKRARELLTMRRIHDEELKVILERARAIEAQMMEVRRQIQDLRQGEPKGETQTDATEPPRPTDESARTCPECGTALPAGSRFCPNCGVRVE